MIKEKKKIKKKKELTFAQEIASYIKTAVMSFLVAAIFTVLLSFHSRSQMIKNLYTEKETRSKIERQVAQQIVAHSDLTASLISKNYTVCMQVGNLYEMAGDYIKAEYAYHFAYDKAPIGNYQSHLKLITVLLAQNKIDDAIDILESVQDTNTLKLIRFKTRAYINLGDKYYSEAKFLKAANAYEQAYYYYSRLTKKDKIVKESIRKRIVNAYLETAGVIVKKGYNSDVARFLKKALEYDPKNLNIQYRLAIVYSDLDPIIALDYFEPLTEKIPQDINYDIYAKTLMKAANIMDIQGNGIQAKYYRYKIHTFDLYVNSKVVYKDDVDLLIEDFRVKKVFFTYKIKAKFKIRNLSSQNIPHLTAEFVLRNGSRERGKVVVKCATKKTPIISNGGESEDFDIKFGNKIFTKRELEKYYIDVYLYKDNKFKTLLTTFSVPAK